MKRLPLVLNLQELSRRRQAAQDAEDWTSELHFGAMAILGGMAWGAIVGVPASIITILVLR